MCRDRAGAWAVKHLIGGSFFSPEEGAGDAFVFTRGLAEHCRGIGVSFAFNTTVRAIECHGGAVQAVHTDKGRISGDAYLVALGPYSPIVLRSIGLNLPIWPVKGYTASIPIDGHRGAPKVGIIEEDNLVAFANLGDTLRIGGKAEFTGYYTSYSEADFRGIMSVSKELFPDAGDYTRPRYWACLRPVSAGGPPILGETPVANLFLNVGHGAAGWTEGCATSRAVADIMNGHNPDLNMEGLRLSDL